MPANATSLQASLVNSVMLRAFLETNSHSFSMTIDHTPAIGFESEINHSAHYIQPIVRHVGALPTLRNIDCCNLKQSRHQSHVWLSATSVHYTGGVQSAMAADVVMTRGMLSIKVWLSYSPGRDRDVSIASSDVRPTERAVGRVVDRE